ncbi:MAG: hypothetical protein ACI86M_001234 [Saprospiraceae bacterium]
MKRAYVREDTIEKKIFRKERINAPESLIIDYSLEYGDTTYANNHQFIVEYVSYQEWFGEMRKTIKVKEDFSGIGLIFVEGFGIAYKGIFFEGPFSYWSFQNVGDICENTVSVETYKENAFKAYPNPTNGLLKLELPVGYAKEAKVKVLDINGKIIHKRQIGNNLTIDISIFQSGLYFIDINGVKKKVIKL